MSNLPKTADLVIVTCYGQKETLTRKAAMAKYLECMACSEGAEHERYETIFFQLMAGRCRVSDQIDWRG